MDYQVYKTVLHHKMRELPDESVTVFTVLHYLQRGNLLEGHCSC